MEVTDKILRLENMLSICLLFILFELKYAYKLQLIKTKSVLKSFYGPL